MCQYYKEETICYFIEVDIKWKKGKNLKVKNLYMRRKIEKEFKSSFLY